MRTNKYYNNLTFTPIMCVYLTLPLVEETTINYKFGGNISPEYSAIQTTNTSTFNARNNQVFLIELLENKKKLESFKKLNFNWNLAYANKFDEAFIDKISSQLANIQIQPKVFPTGRNSIQLEYEKENGDYLELEIFEQSVSCLKIKNNQENEEKINLDNINTIVNEFYA